MPPRLHLPFTLYPFHFISSVPGPIFIRHTPANLLSFFLLVLSTSNPPNHQSHWGALSWCQEFQPCRILTALVAFVWMGWIMVVFLMFASVLFCIANRAWGEPMHGRVYPRDSTVFPQTTQYRASRTA